MRAHVPPDHHVFERGKIGKQPDVLERPRDAARRNVVWLEIRKWLAVEHEFAAIRRVDAGQHVEQ